MLLFPVRADDLSGTRLYPIPGEPISNLEEGACLSVVSIGYI